MILTFKANLSKLSLTQWGKITKNGSLQCCTEIDLGEKLVNSKKFFYYNFSPKSVTYPQKCDIPMKLGLFTYSVCCQMRFFEWFFNIVSGKKWRHHSWPHRVAAIINSLGLFLEASSASRSSNSIILARQLKLLLWERLTWINDVSRSGQGVEID